MEEMRLTARRQVLESSLTSGSPQAGPLSFIKRAGDGCNGNPKDHAEFKSTFQKPPESYSARNMPPTVTFYPLRLKPMVKIRITRTTHYSVCLRDSASNPARGLGAANYPACLRDSASDPARGLGAANYPACLRDSASDYVCVCVCVCVCVYIQWYIYVCVYVQ